MAAIDLEQAVQKVLKEYSLEVGDEVYEAIQDVTKETVKKLKAESTSKFGSGEYSKGWTKTIERIRLTVEATVHGKKPTYSLAHLLENGHALRQGGRTRAITHIAPVNDWAQEEAIARIMSRLEGRL